MTETVKALLPFLEALYYLAGVAVAIVAVIGLGQLKLMKKDMIARSERAAKEYALASAFRFAKCLFLFGRRRALADDLGIEPYYSGPVGDFSPESIPDQLADSSRKRYDTGMTNTPLNELEAISASYTSGVADEKLVFPMLGKPFCGTVSKEYDIIALGRDEPATTNYSNIVKLYGIWSKRLTRREIEVARDSAEENLANLVEEKLPDLSPFGGDDT